MRQALKILWLPALASAALLFSGCDRSKEAEKPSAEITQDDQIMRELASEPVKAFAKTPDDAQDIQALTDFDQRFSAVSDDMEDELMRMKENGSLTPEFAAARKRGEKVVMTNGVFDILHAGHVSYLANARKLGDRLIVAVNSDASTKRLKGETRPVNPLEQRMIVLGALEAVDWVVSFEEDTPQRLIAGILPDLLVKGGDYKPEQIAGSEEVWANGGEVMVLNFEDGCSTTNIIKKIQKDSQ